MRLHTEVGGTTARIRVSEPEPALDVFRLRHDFPAFDLEPELVYLDSASTTQKPHAVLASMTLHYAKNHANVHRGIYGRAARATEEYEGARDAVAEHLNAWDRRSVVFTRNFTEAANLVAYAWAREQLRPGDEIVTTALEHHSTRLPFQLAAGFTGARLRIAGVGPEGAFDPEQVLRRINHRTRLVAITAMSNVTGELIDLAPIRDAVHAVGGFLFVDGAQLTPHAPVDLQALGADFFAFSGHKMLGPTGIGALVARPALLERMEPFLTGGSMILDLGDDGPKWNDIPYKFEAGTPMIAEAAGLHEALRYLRQQGMERIRAHEQRLATHGLQRLAALPGIELYGPGDPTRQGSTFAFNLRDDQGELIHPHDVGTALDTEGIAIRVGHHCAKPLMKAIGIPACCRASAYLYNDRQDLDHLVSALEHTRRFFARS